MRHMLDSGTRNRFRVPNQEHFTRRIKAARVSHLRGSFPTPTRRYSRIEWPDIGLSDLANLTRCKDAALAWAEQQVAAEHRNLSVAQRLKSLKNFQWSSSLVRQINAGGGIPTPKAEPAWSRGMRRAAQ